MASGLLLLRIVLGLTLAGHGAQKLFGVWGGGGPKGTAAGFESMGFRAPGAMALLAGLGEFGGGLGVAAGLLTPFAGLALATVMGVAIFSVHWKNGFWAGNGGYEYNLLIAASAVALAAVGPGRFSLDHAFGWDNLCGAKWGAGAAIAAFVISWLVLALGRKRPEAAAA
ncbi:MAG TPA: DoxX family protein [Gaiellaceae bacterium]|nr:DoxX family protein [Gaiellaceae bacterium]